MKGKESPLRASDFILLLLQMDETVKPLRIPPQISIYSDKHNIFHLVQSMVSSLVIDQPDDPISYLISWLQRSSVDIPRVLLLGPPAAGKRTVAKKLSAELKAVHVTIDSLLQNHHTHTQQVQAHTLHMFRSRERTRRYGNWARKIRSRDGDCDGQWASCDPLLLCLCVQEFPDKLLLKLVQQRLNEADCFNRGWVLEGIPQTRLQALSLQQGGVIPEHVVMLEAPDDVLLERSRGKLVDPLTGDVYHQTFIWPDDDIVTQRLEKEQDPPQKQRLAELQRYRCEVTGLSLAYQHILKIINGDQPHADVYGQVLAFVRTRHRARTPRILLLGPPGSGKSHQARLLSEKYKMADVCCGQLLRSVAAEGSSLGEEIQPYLDNGRLVPDSLVLQVLEQRLSQVDCSCRGWILHGFPCNLQQAKDLQESQHQPNRIFFLELTDDVCLERITLRATDPISGQKFHAVTRPAPSSWVQNRLQTRPEDCTDTVTCSLGQYRTCSAALQAVFPDSFHINADQDPHSVFEALESRLTTD
uniref:adenylate kinase 8 n=1 Tax=Monopterus albus TaxID=43700 RepID=UPI0009B4AB79|nr:adenylate kinase 8 [Monopterus albus]